MEFSDDEIKDKVRKLKLEAVSKKNMEEKEASIRKWEEYANERRKKAPSEYHVRRLLCLNNDSQFRFKVIIFDFNRVRVEKFHNSQNAFVFTFPNNFMNRLWVKYNFEIFLKKDKKTNNVNNQESKVQKIVDEVLKKLDIEVNIIISKIKIFLSK